MTTPESPTITLDALGSLRLSGTLTGPRRLAVLVYLVLARPRGLHSRDTLIGLLWPESDQAAGRHALRNALHSIRQSLGDGIITTSGDALVGVDTSRITCDALQLEEDLAAGRDEHAIARYHGALLQGFFVSDAPEFERWLDVERRRFADAVVAAAWQRADACHAVGDSEGAMRAARRAYALAPDDEPSLRRLLARLGDAGDRAGAARAYDEFADRLKREYDAEPSAETQALVQSMREAPSAAELLAAAPPPRVIPLPAQDATRMAIVRGDSRLAGLHPSTASRPGRRWLRGAVAAMLLLVTALLANQRHAPATPKARSLVVLPMENETGDAANSYIGSGLAEDIARRLEGIGGITIRSGARSEWPATTRKDLELIGSTFESTYLLKTVLRRTADSLEIRAFVVDLTSSVERPIAARRFTTTEIRDVESDMAARVAGAVFGMALPADPHPSATAIDPESYRLMLEGWHHQLTRRTWARAKELFQQAVDLDPSNARAWAGLSSAWAAQTTTDAVPYEQGYEAAESAAKRALKLDSTQGSAWANLGFLRAVRFRSLSTGLKLIQKGVELDPGNPEVFLVKSAVLRHAWQWDRSRDEIRIAERLDPISPFYPGMEAMNEICAGRPEEALRLYDAMASKFPSDSTALQGKVRALAMLGRFEEAIAVWRAQAAASGQVLLADRLARARGRTGYWDVKHLAGQQRLIDLQANAKKTYVARRSFIRAKFAAGDLEGGFRDLEQDIEDDVNPIYRLPCGVEFDEVRGTSRFARIQARVGALPP